MSVIVVQSMVSSRHRGPLVSIYWPKNVEAAQMTPDEARLFALSILNAAEAAEQDAFMFNFATKQMKLKDHEAGGLINEYRKWRGQERGPDAEEDQR